MTPDWSPLKRELAIWRAERRALPLWWRDDDAVEVTPALDRLAALSTDLGLPVHLAVIPKYATPALAQTCATDPRLIPVVHGWAHENHAPQGQKKAEFGHPRAGACDDAARALARMRKLFGNRMLAMFVAPWNRIDPDLMADLPGLGYVAVSTYLARRARLAAPGLVQINTHIDPIHWRAGGGLAPPETLLGSLVQQLRARRAGTADATEPLGFLTHHLVHDVAIWDFSHRCLDTLLSGGAVPLDLLSLKENLP